MNNKHFNKLTPAEAERLALLVEECAEVIQIVGKILRHGYESYNPGDKNRVTNRNLLERELGDLGEIVRLIGEESGDLDITKIAEWQLCKQESMKRYLHHQQEIVHDHE